MSKERSPATELAYVKKDLRDCEKQLRECRAEADLYRRRSSKAEAEAAEWKARFDGKPYQHTEQYRQSRELMEAADAEIERLRAALQLVVTELDGEEEDRFLCDRAYTAATDALECSPSETEQSHKPTG